MAETAPDGQPVRGERGAGARARAAVDAWHRPASPPAGVLFDLDGTLADTEAMWRHAYQRLAADHGVEPAPGWWGRVLGRDLGDAAVALLGVRDATVDERRRLIAALVDAALGILRVGHDDSRHVGRDGAAGSMGVSWRPGARDLVTELAQLGVPTAVVTASPRRLLAAVISHLDIEVDVTVAGDEVTHPKPDPEGYLRAAGLLGIEVHDAVIVEDSPTGVAAAEASGARVLVVPNGVPVADGPARTVAESLSGITANTLAALPRGR